MATHKSAAKRARQTPRRTAVNRQRRSAISTAVKGVGQAIIGSDKAKATDALKKAESVLARGASRGTLHWKTAARKTSRLAKRVKVAAAKKA